MKVTKYQRGQIWWYKNNSSFDGSIQGKTRPIIIVSNNLANQFSNNLIAIPCTTAAKKDMPTHLELDINGNKSTALCENIMSLNILKMGDYIGTCDEELMQELNKCIKIALALDDIVVEQPRTIIKPPTIQEYFEVATAYQPYTPPSFEDNRPIEEKISKREAYEGVGRKGYQKYTRKQMEDFIKECEENTIEYMKEKYGCVSEKAVANKLYRFRKFLKENPE